ncbi:MAG: helix-turn-helix transcriptional regulator [Gammaproteobacteria bacterium]
MVHFLDLTDPATLLAHTPGNPLLWQKFLAQTAHCLHCEAGYMLITDQMERDNTCFLYSSNVSEEYRQHYENSANRSDLFNFFLSKHPRRAFCNQTAEQGSATEIENNALRNANEYYRFGLSIPCNHRYSINLLIERRAAFDKSEIQQGIVLLENILPALEEAIHAEQRHKLNSQLVHHMGGYFDAYIIIDNTFNVLFADPLYFDIISSFDCVTFDGNTFGMKHSDIHRQLVHSMAQNRKELSIHNQCRSCRITLIPVDTLENLYHWECFKDGFVLVFTHDRNANPAVDRLMELYRLSRCEAICALHFMHNPSIADIAASTFRSQETVRNHLKHIMQKMHVHNQAALMKKLLALSSI